MADGPLTTPIERVRGLSPALAALLPLTGGTLTGPLTAPQFNGPLNGNATSATTAANLTGNVAQSQVTGLSSALALLATLASPTFTGRVAVGDTNGTVELSPGYIKSNLPRAGSVNPLAIQAYTVDFNLGRDGGTGFNALSLSNALATFNVPVNASSGLFAGNLAIGTYANPGTVTIYPGGGDPVAIRAVDDNLTSVRWSINKSGTFSGLGGTMSSLTTPTLNVLAGDGTRNAFTSVAYPASGYFTTMRGPTLVDGFPNGAASLTVNGPIAANGSTGSVSAYSLLAAVGLTVGTNRSAGNTGAFSFAQASNGQGSGRLFDTLIAGFNDQLRLGSAIQGTGQRLEVSPFLTGISAVNTTQPLRLNAQLTDTFATTGGVAISNSSNATTWQVDNSGNTNQSGGGTFAGGVKGQALYVTNLYDNGSLGGGIYFANRDGATYTRAIRWEHNSGTLAIDAPRFGLNVTSGNWQASSGDGFTFGAGSGGGQLSIRRGYGNSSVAVSNQADEPAFDVVAAGLPTTAAQRWINSAGTTTATMTTAGSLVLAGSLSTTRLVYGNTDAAPTNTTTPVTWISAYVGATAYKIPLYQ